MTRQDEVGGNPGQQRRRSARLFGIVVHHRSWVYLERWLGLEEIAALEPKPGVPPTSAHLARGGSDQQGSGPAGPEVHSKFNFIRTVPFPGGGALATEAYALGPCPGRRRNL